jgi:hypothetical protein
MRIGRLGVAVVVLKILRRVNAVVLFEPATWHRHRVRKDQSTLTATPNVALNPETGAVRRAATFAKKFRRRPLANGTVLRLPSIVIARLNWNANFCSLTGRHFD